ncbi:alanine racemase [Microvirga vignae]|uniref:Pyridoxal phosphate homeostasis protein n=1 Tax=Microvirga vignae TaxID=1225564 RepID=A0A0H1RF85_9HYPH|nr:YggS family pyridoxal phosphate-dependent enzyme [Microvirga vignae]KLK93838.1 alanine racemase [Microvirga vignae]
MSENDAVEALREVREAIRRAASDYDRDPSSITLVAVSKTFSGNAIEPVLAAGQRVFGENYVQEAKAKWPGLRSRYPDVELHMIGPLQSNKAKEAVELFDVIHTLDRPSLAEALAKEIAKQGKKPRLLVQVNTGEEPQKGGIAPGEVDAFLEACRTKYGLEVEGLMCIPPAEDPPSPHFALLNTLADRHGLQILSMGMSADFDEAIQLGATHVRVGSAIFGARSKPAA